MSEKALFVLRPKPHPTRQRACEAIMQAPDGYIVTLQPPKRSLVQNSKLWAMLSDVSKQVIHHGLTLDAESWKHLFTAELHGYTVVPNLQGKGLIALGMHTSKMSVGEMADLIECIYCYGAEHNVVWSDVEESA